MSVEGVKEYDYSESFITLTRYLNPQIPSDESVADGTTFELTALTDEEAKILEMFLKATERTSIILSSKDDLSVDHKLMILKAIGENPAFKIIDINFPQYVVNDLATLKDFISWPIERQRPVQVLSAEHDVEDLTTALSGLLSSARNDIAEVRTAASNGWGSLLTGGRTLLNTYVAPAFNLLFEEDNPPVALDGPQMTDADVGPSTSAQRRDALRQ